MAYRLSPSDPDAAAALRRIAREQIDAALAATEAGGDLHAGLHEARKACKKLRGLLCLVRPVFSGFRAENATIRDAARRLAPLRQRGAGLETLGRLVVARGDGIGAGAAQRARQVLAARTDAAGMADMPTRIAAFRADLIACRARIEGWRLKDASLAALAGGARKSYAAGRKVMARARDTRAPTDLHDWRKRVKDHWYHARLLKPVAEEVLAGRIADAGRLADVLGDHHDLVDFTALIEAGIFDPATAGALRAPVAAGMARLEADAFDLGPGLYADKPGALEWRWEGWLSDWPDRTGRR